MTIITNDRMVDVEQKTLFSRVVAEVDLYHIQDVTSQVEGLFASVFNYGNIIVQTAAPVTRIVINNAPDPHKMREVILDLAAEDKKYHNK